MGDGLLRKTEKAADRTFASFLDLDEARDFLLTTRRGIFLLTEKYSKFKNFFEEPLRRSSDAVLCSSPVSFSAVVSVVGAATTGSGHDDEAASSYDFYACQ